MPKPEWGTKRLCPACGARYYDMKRPEIVCPACKTPFDAEGAKKPRRATVAAATPAAAIAEAVDLPEVEEEEEVVAEEEAAVVVPPEEAPTRTMTSAQTQEPGRTDTAPNPASSGEDGRK